MLQRCALPCIENEQLLAYIQRLFAQWHRTSQSPPSSREAFAVIYALRLEVSSFCRHSAECRYVRANNFQMAVHCCTEGPGDDRRILHSPPSPIYRQFRVGALPKHLATSTDVWNIKRASLYTGVKTYRDRSQQKTTAVSLTTSCCRSW